MGAGKALEYVESRTRAVDERHGGGPAVHFTVQFRLWCRGIRLVLLQFSPISRTKNAIDDHLEMSV